MISVELSLYQWLTAAMCGILVGLANKGVTGLGLLNVALFAAIFGWKPSTGMLLPMICFGDVLALKYYHRHTAWRYVFRLVPSALTGTSS